MNDPHVILADEPTAILDTKSVLMKWSLSLHMRLDHVKNQQLWSHMTNAYCLITIRFTEWKMVNYL